MLYNLHTEVFLQSAKRLSINYSGKKAMKTRMVKKKSNERRCRNVKAPKVCEQGQDCINGTGG